MSDKHPDLELATDELVMPSTNEGLARLLRLILAKPYITSIVMRMDNPVKVTWWKAKGDSLTDPGPDDTASVVLDRIELTESESTGSAKEKMVDAMLELHLQDYSVTHILCSTIKEFKDWVGLPSMVKLPKLGPFDYQTYLGVALVPTADVPAGTVVVCGASVLSDYLSAIQAGIRVVMETENGSDS